MQTKNITLSEVKKSDISMLQDLIKQMSLYEKRPEDMTATKEMLEHWIFDKQIATALFIKQEDTTIGYVIYYPVFGSFAAIGNVHLEDFFLKKEHRGRGIGTYVFTLIAKRIQEEGYAGIEWNCLDWNLPSIKFYEKLGAKYETGRKYFEYSLKTR